MSWEEEERSPRYLRTCSPGGLKRWSWGGGGGGEAEVPPPEDLVLHPWPTEPLREAIPALCCSGEIPGSHRSGSAHGGSTSGSPRGVSPPGTLCQKFSGAGAAQAGERQPGGYWGDASMQTSLALRCFESVVSSLPAGWCLETFQRPQTLPQPITATVQTGFNVRLRVPPTFPLSG